MNVSVIIPTYNGESKIRNLLVALTKQNYSDFELIVAIDGSMDRTEMIVHEFEPVLNIKVVRQGNKGRAAVRNLGVKNALGDLLIFYDDDMIPSPSSVQKHIELHSQKSNMILSGNQTEEEEHHKTDIQNYKAWLTKKWTGKYTREITQLRIENLFFTAANCSMSRQIFEQLSGFDERLSDAEDFDLAYRAIEKNISVFFDRSNIALHNDLITCEGYVKRIRQYQLAQQRLKELHPERNSAVGHRNYFKHLAYRLFAFSFFLKLIDNSKLFMIFPVKIRYRFYSIIIQSLAVEYPV